MNKYVVVLFMIYACNGASANNIRTLFDPTALTTFTMPDSCKSKGMEFCFDNSTYPLDIVKELLKDIPSLIASNDDDEQASGGFQRRQGCSPDEDECRSNSPTKDIIYYIVDNSGKDRVVVQLEGKFEQHFSVMWCNKDGPVSTRTSQILGFRAAKYNLSCHNKYMDYDFLVLSLEPDVNGKWKMERVKTKSGIPVCCACRYEKD